MRPPRRSTHAHLTMLGPSVRQPWCDERFIVRPRHKPPLIEDGVDTGRDAQVSVMSARRPSVRDLGFGSLVARASAKAKAVLSPRRTSTLGASGMLLRGAEIQRLVGGAKNHKGW